MKRTALFLFSGLLFTCLSSRAQNPGFLGKHIGICYQVSFFASPVFFDVAEGQPYEILWPSAKHSFSLNLTPSRRINFNLHYSYFSMDGFFGQLEILNRNPLNGSSTVEFKANKKLQRIQTHFIEGSLNIFFTKLAAPIGNHIIFKVGTATGGLKSGNTITGQYVGYMTSTVTDTLTGMDSYNCVRVGLGYGKRLMLNSRIYCDYSFIVHFFSGSPYAWERNSSVTWEADYLGYWYGRNVRQLNRYELNFGLGVMLF